MPSYKLTYFNYMGITEPIRILFKIVGVPFDDVRVPGPYGEEREAWQKMKPNIGLGNLPVLEIDGVELPQRNAILRYLAREHGLTPESSWDIAQVDVVVDTALDLVFVLTILFEETDQEKKKKLTKEFETEGCQTHLNKFEKLLKRNNGGTGWFVGDKVTIADMVVFSMLHDNVQPLIGTAVGDLSYMKNHEILRAFMDRFKAIKEVSEWLKERPVTRF